MLDMFRISVSPMAATRRKSENIGKLRGRVDPVCPAMPRLKHLDMERTAAVT